MEITAGTMSIVRERSRQIHILGHTAEHDDAHTGGDWGVGDTPLVNAAIAYLRRHDAWWPEGWAKRFSQTAKIPTPQERVQELTRAGALIAAEIDRLKRSTNV